VFAAEFETRRIREDQAMLVLSRQKDQTIMIGDLIEITIVDIRGDKVRLGITAPTAIPVHRKEVYEAIQSENQAAAHVAVTDVSLLESIVKQAVDLRPQPAAKSHGTRA
jgi:carbon storage regulator